jgi:hypothetical protein
VIGDVAQTVGTFVEKFRPAPIGAVFLDLDYYSSSKQALALFDTARAAFLPRAFMYADDIFWNDGGELYCEYNGEHLAINEFNAEHAEQKLAVARFLSAWSSAEYWHHKIFVYHDFAHADYSRYVGIETPHQIPLLGR